MNDTTATESPSPLDGRGFTRCPSCGRSYSFDSVECEACRLGVGVADGRGGYRVRLWTVVPSAHGLVWQPPGWTGRTGRP